MKRLTKRERELLTLLFIAEDYLKVHWDMRAVPLRKIRNRLRRKDARELSREKP